MICIDADASTGIANFDFDHLTPHQRHDLLEQGPALPYAVRPGAKTLIIGPGRRLGRGARPGLRQPRHHRRRDQPHHRRRPSCASASRSSATASTCGPTSTSTWRTAAASCAAAPTSTRCCRPPWWIPGPPPPPAPSRFPKTTSTPPTPSATTCSHLTDDGLVAFTRWGFDPPRESLRLVSLAMEALGQIGESRAVAARHRGPREARCRAGARRTPC